MFIYHTFRKTSNYEALQVTEEMNLELSRSNDNFNECISEPISYYHEK